MVNKKKEWEKHKASKVEPNKKAEVMDKFIPKQLREPEFRFNILRKKNKAPIELKWEDTSNYNFRDDKLIKHLESGGNYGVIGGFGSLVIVDCDSEEVAELCKLLPKTFCVKSVSPREYKKHYYFICDEKFKPIRFTEVGVGDLGDLRSVGQYVVAPNCYVNEKYNEKKGYAIDGTSKVVNDVPIAKVTGAFLRSIFQKFIDPFASTEVKDKKEYPTDTTKRFSDFTRNCRVPDYILDNTLEKVGTSKNYLLFPYVIDILNARDVSDNLYEKLAEKQGHDFGAVKGWVKKAKEGTLAKCSCKKMQKYIDTNYSELKEDICGDCPVYKKQKKKEAKNLFSRRGQLQSFYDVQPFFYDKSNMFWFWDNELKKWVLSDEIDFLVSIQKELMVDTLDSKTRTELIAGFKQIGRENKPKPMKKTWIQFKDKIIDIKTGEEFEATSKYFITNPIPFSLGKSEKTPNIDKLLVEWVGEKHKQELYEFLFYSICSDRFMQRIYAFCGGGSNGKGTMIKLTKKFLGEENYVSTELRQLAENQFETAIIYKKLLAIMGEVSYDDLKSTNVLKQIAGEDSLRFCFKGKTPFTDDNSCLGVCLTNSLPITPDKSLGFYRKWFIVDFPNQFKEISKDLIAEIPEEEFENLALKCLNGLKELYKKRIFTNEGDFEARIKRYEERSNPVMRFIEERCEEVVGENIILREFTNECNRHFKRKHLRVLTTRQIGKILREEGFAIGNIKFEDTSIACIKNIRMFGILEIPEIPEVPVDFLGGKQI